ncbi:MAG: nucleotidyltransferase domain-containing protein [candidate division WOR-3 bacterium]
MKIGYESYKKLLEAYISILQNELGDSLISVVLYGSVARGSAAINSDIDLLIVVKDVDTSYYKKLKPIIKAQKNLEMSEIFKEYSRNGLVPYFSYLILTYEDALKNRNIYLDIIDEGIILYDPTRFFREKLNEFKKRIEELGSRKIVLDDGRWYWDLKPDLKFGEEFEL